MKKTFCTLLMILFLCGCAITNSKSSAINSAISVNSTANSVSSENASSINFASFENSENAEDSKSIYMSLDSVGGERSNDVIEFINNPRDNPLYPDMHIIFRFEEHNGQLLLTGISSEDGSRKQGPFLALNDPDNWRWGELKSSEYFQRAIAFLCDEDAIRQCFRENGIENIQKIVILNLSGMGDEAGYAITAITESQAYFMTVPLSNEEYGDYIFQKVYTQDEFLEVFSPRPAKVFINEKETAFSTTPLLGYVFLEMDLFEFLDALDVQYTFDEVHKTISANDVTLQMDEFEYGWSSVTITKGDDFDECAGVIRYVEGKYIGDMLLHINLGYFLGYEIDFHYDDYSVRIVNNE